jgi:hypothetical protein
LIYNRSGQLACLIRAYLVDKSLISRVSKLLCGKTPSADVMVMHQMWWQYQTAPGFACQAWLRGKPQAISVVKKISTGMVSPNSLSIFTVKQSSFNLRDYSSQSIISFKGIIQLIYISTASS